MIPESGADMRLLYLRTILKTVHFTYLGSLTRVQPESRLAFSGKRPVNHIDLIQTLSLYYRRCVQGLNRDQLHAADVLAVVLLSVNKNLLATRFFPNGDKLMFMIRVPVLNPINDSRQASILVKFVISERLRTRFSSMRICRVGRIQSLAKFGIVFYKFLMKLVNNKGC